MLLLVIALLLGGLIIGALGRLLVPGPNPMGIWATIAVGILGSLAGGLLGRLAFGLRYRYAGGLAFILSVLCTALIVAAVSRRGRRTRHL
jgi:uncharacterized membrane protein YeaQ/YmgE (transglycosylase-associated protein family)